MSKNKGEFVALLLLIIIIIAGAVAFVVSRFMNVNQIEKEGVFVVGKITSSSSRKNGKSFDLTYVYKGKSYETSIVSLAYKYTEGDLKFLRISSSDPAKSMIKDEYPKPGPCITFETAPAEGWKEIPECK